jgi:hypothetical protein
MDVLVLIVVPQEIILGATGPSCPTNMSLVIIITGVRPEDKQALVKTDRFWSNIVPEFFGPNHYKNLFLCS